MYSILQNLFGKEADKLERSNDDERTCIFLRCDVLFVLCHIISQITFLTKVNDYIVTTNFASALLF